MYRKSKGISRLMCCLCLAAACFLTGNQAFATTSDFAAGGGASSVKGGQEWQVSSDDDVRAAVAEIKEKRDNEGLTEATLVFLNDVEFTYDKHPGSGYESGSKFDSSYVGRNYFSGIEGVTLTLKSPEGAEPSVLKNFGATWGSTRMGNAGFSVNNGETARAFTGDLVFDNVVLDPVRDKVFYFAQGHRFETTDRFSMTKPVSLYGGLMGKRERLDGLGFGSDTGIDADGNTLGWKDLGHAGVPSTHLELRGGQFSEVFGGGYNGAVSGDTYVMVALPNDDHSCGYIYGGGDYKANGRADEGVASAPVGGNATVEALSGSLGSIYGGSYHGRIDGNSSVTVGQQQSDQRVIYDEIYGGGDQSTLGGNASVTVENTAHPKNDTANIYAGGFIDAINGTTELVLNGGSNDHWVFAGGMNIGAHDKSAKILNKNDEEVAAKITINGGDWREVYSTVETNYSSTASQEINGDVLVELNGGHVDYFSLSALQTHVLGDSILAINGGELGNFTTAISGYQYDDSEGGNTYKSGKVEGKRIVNLNNTQPMKCWQIYAIDQINVNNTAPFIARGTADEGALRSCGDVNIQGGTLALMGPNELIDTGAINGTNADGASKAKGDLTVAAGAALALNATGDGLSTPGYVNAEGSATGAGKLLVVKPSGSDWISTDMSQGDPQVGEVYIRSNATDETAAPNTAANMVKLANSPTSRYVEYTQDASAIAPSFAHAWRIADDPDAKTVTVTFDKNGGDTEASPNKKQVTLTGGATSGTIDALPVPPTRADHEFAGWNTAANGQGDAFTEQTPVGQDITVYAQWKASAPNPTYTVTYTDGVDDEEVFVDQVTSGLTAGAATPAFNGTPSRQGYEFKGWNPEVAATVTGNVVYTAQWQKADEPGPGPDPTYTVTYTDGVTGEVDFADQVTTGLDEGDATPAFKGTPTREGYEFIGWKPEVAPTVTEDVVYAAQWKKKEGGGIDPVPLYTVTYTDGVDGEEVFADQVTSGLVAGAATPSFKGEPSRAGYTFEGWKPEVAPTVTADATYIAQWAKKDEPVLPDTPDGPVDPDAPTPDEPSDQGGFEEPDSSADQSDDSVDTPEESASNGAASIPATNDPAAQVAVPFAVLAVCCVTVAAFAAMRIRGRIGRSR